MREEGEGLRVEGTVGEGTFSVIGRRRGAHDLLERGALMEYVGGCRRV